MGHFQNRGTHIFQAVYDTPFQKKIATLLCHSDNPPTLNARLYLKQCLSTFFVSRHPKWVFLVLCGTPRYKIGQNFIENGESIDKQSN